MQDEHVRHTIEHCSTDHRSGRLIGGVVGGVIGGVAGNRLADGNRTLGTVVGAGAGAVGGAAVGAAIDRANDRECDGFFRAAAAGETYQDGPGWAPLPGYIWVPVVSSHSPARARGYTETVVTTEEIDAPTNNGAGVRHRFIQKPAHRHAPRKLRDKRVYVGGS